MARTLISIVAPLFRSFAPLFRSLAPFPRIASLVQWDVVEADSYWSLTRLLDGLQDNYTFAQPGIQRTVFKLREIMHKVPLAPARQP